VYVTLQHYYQYKNYTYYHPKEDVLMADSPRGFEAMQQEGREDEVRDIAAEGGRASHAVEHTHEFDSEEAKKAGQKGGEVAHERGTAHEFDSEEARAAGKLSHKNDG
jgi:general stress protein YciG